MQYKNIRRSLGVGIPPRDNHKKKRHYSLFKWPLQLRIFVQQFQLRTAKKSLSIHTANRSKCLPRAQNSKGCNNAVILDVSATDRSRNWPNNDGEQLQYKTRFSITMWILLVPTENKTFLSGQWYQQRYERRDVHGENTPWWKMSGREKKCG